ncbi:hypothetical protein TIFTF001_027335 [Ficus carica]|uniref:Uncharacterized protein n=1 Tax=Ficus carica TaxID=3494 RepID=A0AA88DP15_FICCA|nr:hypothetical protein TIFTF001_027335 [Ficus carica]
MERSRLHHTFLCCCRRRSGERVGKGRDLMTENQADAIARKEAYSVVGRNLSPFKISPLPTLAVQNCNFALSQRWRLPEKASATTSFVGRGLFDRNPATPSRDLSW